MLQQFNFQDHTVRVVLDDDNQPMFVAKDVATVLGYTRTTDAINTHCKGAVILRTLSTKGGGVVKYDTVSDSLGRSQEMRVIDVYELDLNLVFGETL